jgi:hypothetical protein
MLKERMRTHHEGRKGVKYLDGRWPRCLRKQDLMKLQLESTERVNKTYRKTNGLEIVKRIGRSPVRLQKMMDWMLWRGRPPLKWRKKLQIEQEPVM